jgi:hypothetical protein
MMFVMMALGDEGDANSSGGNDEPCDGAGGNQHSPTEEDWRALRSD